jgi:hypothetical protein
MLRRAPQVGEDVDAAGLDLGGLRVLVLVDLSMMFLSAVSAINCAAIEGIQVPTNVARFSRACPSSSRSDLISS